MRRSLSSLILIFLGLFLIADKMFFHLLTFNYDKIGLGWLDPIFGHEVWGFILVAVGLHEWGRRR